MANTLSWNNVQGNFGASTAGLAQASKTLERRISTLQNLSDRVSTYGKEMEAKAILEKENILKQQGQAISNQAMLDAVDASGRFHQDRYAASITKSMEQTGAQNYSPEDLVKLQSNIDTNTADMLRINAEQDRNAIYNKNNKLKEQEINLKDLESAFFAEVNRKTNLVDNLNNPKLSNEERIAIKQAILDIDRNLDSLILDINKTGNQTLINTTKAYQKGSVDYTDNNPDAKPYAYHLNRYSVPTEKGEELKAYKTKQREIKALQDKIFTTKFTENLVNYIQKGAKDKDLDAQWTGDIQKAANNPYVQNYLKYMIERNGITDESQLYPLLAFEQEDGYLQTNNFSTEPVTFAIDKILSTDPLSFNGNISNDTYGYTKLFLDTLGLPFTGAGILQAQKILQGNR